MTAARTKKVAPDGGWAWMVCLGVSMVNFSTRSLEPSFGLLFGDLLQTLKVETTGASVIMSTLDCVVNFSGFFVGPVIKTFSYRKVCVIGAFVSALGLLLTAPAESMVHILATYSIMGGLGVGFASSASFVSLNHYFSKKRGQAVGLSMAGTGLGLMVMPQLVRLLLDAYEFRGAVLVLGGLAFHSVLGSCLLQPIKRHLKEVPIDEEMLTVKEMDRIEETDEENDDKFETNAPMIGSKARLGTSLSVSRMPRAATCDKPLPEFERSKRSMTTAASVAAMQRVTSAGNMSEESRKRKVSVISNLSHMDFTGSHLQMHIDAADDDDFGISMRSSKKSLKKKGIENGGGEIELEIRKPPSEGFFRRFVNLMDLDLLKDPSYLNLVFGLSIFWAGELNFRMLTPFFISNMGYSKTETAFCLSVTAITDILVRLILPPIFDKRNISKKLIFYIAAFFVSITRSVLAMQTEWVSLMVWLSICGFFRGVCLSNFTLTISEYSSLEKLPAAFGLHMVGKGIFVLILGPILGYVRDASGSYPACILVQNGLIMCCVIAWTIEYAINFFRRRKIMHI